MIEKRTENELKPLVFGKWKIWLLTNFNIIYKLFNINYHLISKIDALFQVIYWPFVFKSNYLWIVVAYTHRGFTLHSISEKGLQKGFEKGISTIFTDYNPHVRLNCE